MWIKNFRRSHYLCSTMWELWTKRGWRPVQQAPKCKSRSRYHMTYQWFWSCGTTLYTVTLATTQPKKLSILAVALYKIVMSSNCRLFNIFLILSLPWRIPRCLGNIVDLGNRWRYAKHNKDPPCRKRDLWECDPTRTYNRVLGSSLGSDKVRHSAKALFKQLHSPNSGGLTYHRYIISYKEQTVVQASI